MPVVHIRVDNRLIHGQVLIAWTKQIKFNHVVVANDQVSADPMQVKLLKLMAAMLPRVSILSIKDCAALCTSSEAEKQNIFLIVKTASDGAALIDAGFQFPSINLGNQGYAAGWKSVTKTFFINEPEARALQRLHQAGVRMTARMLPSDPDTDCWPTVEKLAAEWLEA